MHEEWLLDGRQIPDEVMGYIRKMAVHAVRERGESPELVAQIFNFNRSCIYRWLKQYDEGGYAALDSRMPPGASPVITSEMDEWLKQIVLNSTPFTLGVTSRPRQYDQAAKGSGHSACSTSSACG